MFDKLQMQSIGNVDIDYGHKFDSKFMFEKKNTSRVKEGYSNNDELSEYIGSYYAENGVYPDGYGPFTRLSKQDCKYKCAEIWGTSVEESSMRIFEATTDEIRKNSKKFENIVDKKGVIRPISIQRQIHNNYASANDEKRKWLELQTVFYMGLYQLTGQTLASTGEYINKMYTFKVYRQNNKFQNRDYTEVHVKVDNPYDTERIFQIIINYAVNSEDKHFLVGDTWGLKNAFANVTEKDLRLFGTIVRGCTPTREMQRELFAVYKAKQHEV